MYNKVFISYATEDSKSALELYNFLTSCNYNPWLDKKDLLPGQNFEIEIPAALKRADYIILLFSKSSVKKRGFVQKEWNLALKYCEEKLDSDIFIIPCKIEDCDIPEKFRSYQWIDLRDSDSFGKILSALNLQRKKIEKDGIVKKTAQETEQTPKSNQKKSSKFSIIVIMVIIFLGIVSSLFVPEVRHFFGIKDDPQEFVTPVIVDTEIKLQKAIKNGKNKVNITIPRGVVIRLNTCVTIGEDKEITIEGEDNVTIEGNKSVRLFEILPGATLKIKNLILTDGKSEDLGGAIHNTGRLFIDDCTFRNNSADTGGAIFNGNKKDTGGGLMIIGSSAFLGNHANLTGGAIFNVSARSPAMIENSSFKNNTSYQGGAVYNLASLLMINASRFTENKARNNGGALYNENGYLLMDGREDNNKSYFKDNHADDVGGAISNKNGGVYLLHGYVLSENVANGWGGAIFNEESGSINLLEVVIKGNKASKGDDVFNHSSGNKVTMENSIVEKPYGNNFFEGKVDLSPFMRPE